ncbi:hypothetical protein HYR99_03680 [Candidatus Poribacteria bacterium]|nr:hypothetical protein [Candidatus Poribacteria bacterium]
MRNLEHYFTVTCSVLLMLGLSTLALAQGEKKETIVGHWTFEPGKELVDLTGNFVDVTLNGAKVEKGQLKVSTGKWATASPMKKGPKIKEKTLVSWAILDNLDVQSGSILTIDKISVDEFDAMVYGERQPHRWMAGSSFFRRTQDAAPGFEEKKTGELIYMAYTYEDSGGNAHIKLYHNGDLIGDYTMGPIATWEPGDAEVFFGQRHGNPAGPGNLDARIEEARIYGAVLSEAEIKKLKVGTLDVEARGKLTTVWAAMKAK